MIINLTAAGLAGIGIPVFMHKIKIDPAVSAGVFITTVTDCCGYASFLGIAKMFL